jgi:UDP-N-acetylglucosamine 1-carboxyvinyltransferase
MGGRMAAGLLTPPPPTVRSEAIIVHGGWRLEGEVPISGYKHALTVVVAAAVAMGTAVTLRNVPITTESLVLERILSEMGASSRLADGRWELDTSWMRSMPVPADLSELVHASLYLAPALLARFGEVSFSHAGGDMIGPPELGGRRPARQVGAVMERFGATVDDTDGLAVTGRNLHSCEIDLREFSSHPSRLRGPATSSATKTALLLAAAAEGETVLRHPVDREATRELCDFLRASGTTVTEVGEEWRIRRGDRRSPVVHHLISDSTEIVTFIACAAHVGASLRLTGITGARTWRAIADELRVLRGVGVPLSWGRDWLEVRPPAHLRPLDQTPFDIECNGFSTDAHPLLTLVLLGASGESRIADHVWSSRFAYAQLLTEMGADLDVSGGDGSIVIRPSRLEAPRGVVLRPTDSRASAVALLAALGVEGTTRIEDAGHLARSYQDLVGKLRAVGAQVEVSDSSAGR